MRYLLLLAAALCLFGPARAATPSQFFTYDTASLALAKQKVAAKDPLYLPSYERLLKEANAALAHARYSVVDKTLTPASGDKHDFFSFGPYWWPDPKKKDGLPYIRKDGLHNPAASTEGTDGARLGHFAHDVTVLALSPNSNARGRRATPISRSKRSGIWAATANWRAKNCGNTARTATASRRAICSWRAT